MSGVSAMQVIEWALKRQPSTCEEIEDRLSLSHQTCSAQITHLKNLGRIVPTGEKRLTRSGVRARVYRHVDSEEAPIDGNGQLSMFAGGDCAGI